MNFMQIVVIVFTLIFIGCVIMIIVTGLKNPNKPWPPRDQPCPDYWSELASNQCQSVASNYTIPTPGGTTGTVGTTYYKTTAFVAGSNPYIYNFSSLTDCDKLEFTKLFKVNWNGISYGSNFQCPM